MTKTPQTTDAPEATITITIKITLPVEVEISSFSAAMDVENTGDIDLEKEGYVAILVLLARFMAFLSKQAGCLDPLDVCYDIRDFFIHAWEDIERAADNKGVNK